MTKITEIFAETQQWCYLISCSRGWHSDKDGNPIVRNEGEMIALMHSELSEALEVIRKGGLAKDDKLPHRLALEVELADCVIRILDYAQMKGLDIGGALVDKCHYNMNREDHSLSSRFSEGGKAF